MEAIRTKGNLLLELVYQVWGDAMRLPSVGRGQALLTGVKRLERWVLAGLGAGKGSPSRVAMGVRVGMVPLQRQGLSRASWRIVVAIAPTVVVVSSWAITILRRAVAGASPTTRGMLGHATADMVPFHRRRGMVSRPGRKGALGT